jgi:hypothetical protein
MCEETKVRDLPVQSPAANNNLLVAAVAFCGAITVASTISTIVLAFKAADQATPTITVVTESPNVVVNSGDVAMASVKGPEGTNPCAGKRPDLDNVNCIVDAMTNVGPQSGANVTKGYNGGMSVDHVPITTPYWQNGMCPVNVHWHFGAEHYSSGQYDENGSGPVRASLVNDLDRRRLQTYNQVRQGYQCGYYNQTDDMFTKPYVWRHCVDMMVGGTYEVHWPHSAAGACGTMNQYQTPFYDGVFCTDDVLTDTASQIGVQAQVFTIVNNENYYYPDLMRGMIVDGEMGTDIAMYTGSTTGTTRDNTMCSQFSPITWQVDRKCHLISASTFDKMCADMKAQRDDMTNDLFPHGSRELVQDDLVANNHANRFLRAN